MKHSRLFFNATFFIFILLWSTFLKADTVTLRDPTKPAVPDVVVDEGKDEKKKAEEDNYVLKGIFISQNRRAALINETFVKEGDKLGLDCVETIKKNAVVLSRPGQKRTIYLFELQNLE